MGGRWLVAVAATAVLTLTACTGPAADSEDGSAPAARSGDTSGTTTGAAGGPAPYLPVPDGVVLTDPGSELGVGESAVVAWQPRQGQVGVLRMTVRKMEHADIKALKEWQLDAAGRRSSLYYLTVAVENIGEQDLGGSRIPLYVLDDAHTLVESSSFRTKFAPCPSRAPPDAFEQGAETTACLVYLVPRRGSLQAASFRPTDEFNPITWVGKVTEPKKPEKPKRDAAQ